MVSNPYLARVDEIHKDVSSLGNVGGIFLLCPTYYLSIHVELNMMEWKMVKRVLKNLWKAIYVLVQQWFNKSVNTINIFDLNAHWIVILVQKKVITHFRNRNVSELYHTSSFPKFKKCCALKKMFGEFKKFLLIQQDWKRWCVIVVLKWWSPISHRVRKMFQKEET